MHYLVVDTRFASPVHVFLERDPRGDAGFPGLDVRAVELEATGDVGGFRDVVGQDPYRADAFRRFPSDGAARAAGFGVVEPRYIGATWASYTRAFGFGERRLAR